jgi:hypothetical protein
VGVQHVREANATQLNKKFGEIAFKDGKSINDFSMRIFSPANKIRVLGTNLGDTEIVKKILEVVPDSLSHVAIAIETFYDLSTLSIEEVVGHLCQVEEHQRKKKAAPSLVS